MMESLISEYLPLIKDNAIVYGFNFIKALLIFFIGKWVAKRLAKAIGHALTRTTDDAMLNRFIYNISYAMMLMFIIITAISQLGVETTSLIAVLGAAGLAIGLALQGSLSNFAAGVMTVVFRPYNIGDVVEISGQTGKVENLDIFNLTLRLPDDTKVIIPNGQALSDVITNFTESGKRRIDMVIGISYDADIKQAKAIISKILADSEYVFDHPKSTVGVIELADNSVNLAVRPWVKSGDYLTANMELLETIKYALDEANIGIPYPQREVHVYQHNS